MLLSHKLEGTIITLSIIGYLESLKGHEIEEYITPILQEHTIDGIIINLEKVSIIDSSGIGIIYALHGYLKERNMLLTLCCMNKLNQELLEITQMVKLVECFVTEEEAQGYIQKNSQ